MVLTSCCSKYLGRLELNFDSDGNLKLPVNVAGVTKANPIFLDNQTKMNKTMINIINKYKEKLANYAR